MPPEGLLSAGSSAADNANAMAQQVISHLSGSVSSAISTAESAAQRVISMFAISGNSAIQTGTMVLSSAISTAQEMASRVRVQVMQLGTTLISSFSQIRGYVTSAVFGGIGAISGFAFRVAGVISNSSGLVSNIGRTVVGGVLGLVGGMVRLLTSSTTNGLAGVTGVVSGLVFGLVGAVSSLFRSIGRMITGIVNGLAFVGLSLIQAGASLGPIAIVILGIIGNIGLAFAAKLSTGIGSVLSFVGRGLTTLVSSAGSLISNLAPRIMAFSGQIFGGVWSAVKSAGSVIQTIFTTLAGWAGTAWQWVSGLATKAFSFAAANFAPLVTTIGSVVSTVATFGLALVRAIGVLSIMGLAAAGIFKAAQSAMEFAQNAKLFSAQTGLSLGASARIQNQFGAQGIGQNAVTQAFGNQNPAIFGMKARIFGLPGYDAPDFGERLAKRFQGMNSQGMMGNLVARAMMRTLGIDNPDFLKLAATPVGIQRQNSNFSNRLQQNLGMTPKSLDSYANAIPALVNRIGTAFTFVTQKLATVALPVVENVLGALTKWVGNNAANIGGWIESAVKWLFVQAPVILADGLVTISSMVSNGVTNLIKWASWVVTQLPTILETGTQAIADTLRSWATSFSQWAPNMINGFADWLVSLGNTLASWVGTISGNIAGALKSFAQFLFAIWSNQNSPIRVMALQIAKGFDLMVDTARDFVGKLAAAAAGLGDALLLSPFGAILAKIANISFQDPNEAYKRATSGIASGGAEKMVNRFFAGPTLPYAANGIQSAADDLTAQAADLMKSLKANFGDISTTARANGLRVVKGITGGLNSAADALAPQDGTDNVGKRVGDFIASNVVPVLRALEKIEPGVKSLADAAQAFKNGVGTKEERMTAWQKEMLSAQWAGVEQLKRLGRQDALPRRAEDMRKSMLDAWTKEDVRTSLLYGG